MQTIRQVVYRRLRLLTVRYLCGHRRTQFSGLEMDSNNRSSNANGLSDHDEEATVQQRYREAVGRLNDLQSNAATLSKAIVRGRTQSSNVEDMRKRLQRIGLSVSVKKDAILYDLAVSVHEVF